MPLSQIYISCKMSNLFWQPWKLPSLSYGPVVEPVGPNAFITEQPVDILKRKKGMDIPLLLSFVADEGLNIGAGIILSLFSAVIFISIL